MPNTAPTFSAGHTGYQNYTFGSIFEHVIALPGGGLLTAGSQGLRMWLADGTPDTRFNQTGSVIIRQAGSPTALLGAQDAQVLSSGKVLAFSVDFGNIKVAGDDSLMVSRYNADGSVDTTFGAGKGAVSTSVGTGAYLTIAGSAILSDGSVLVAVDKWMTDADGAASPYTAHHVSLVRYLSDGRLDTSFGVGGIRIDDNANLRVSDMTVQGDGKIVISGNYGTISTQFAIVRLNADGSRDQSFGNNGMLLPTLESDMYASSRANAITIQPDGKIIAIGYATLGTDYNYQGFSVVRYNDDGTLDTSFSDDGMFTRLFAAPVNQAVGETSIAKAVHVNDDGSILISGTIWDFADVHTTNRIAVARLHADGSLDRTFGVNGVAVFDPGSSVSAWLDDMSVTSDGHIVLSLSSNPTGGGYVTPVFVKYSANGVLESGFGDASTARSNTADSHQGYPDQFLNPAISVSDAELAASGKYTGAKLTLQRDGGANASDQFGAGGALSFSGGHAYVNGVDIGTVSNSGGALSIVFNANASGTLVNQALRTITYQNSGSYADQQHVQIKWTFSDGNTGAQGTGGALSAQFSTDVTLHTSDASYWIDALLHRSDPAQTAQQVRSALRSELGSTPGLTLKFANDGGSAAYTSAERAVIQKALDAVTGVIDLRAAGATITVHNTKELAAGSGASRQLQDGSGDIYFAFGSNASANSAELLQQLLKVLGLSNPALSPNGGLPGAEDHVNLSLLSSGSGANSGVLGVLDIAALQYVYGLNPSARSGNETYQLSATSANFIWDGAGTDTISAAGLSQDLMLHLAPGYWDYLGSKGAGVTAAGQITINQGSVIENAIGGSGNDNITGTAGDNVLQGGAGNDVLTGLAGNDTLDGGAGQDTAVYSGLRANYRIAATSDGYTVTSLLNGEGTDTLRNIERIRFQDTTLKFNSLPTGALSIAGTAANYQTLSAVSTLSDLDGMGTLSYQWYQDGKAVSGSTSSSYALTAADVGKAITVSATYVDGEGTRETVSSAATSQVINANALPTGSIAITGTAEQGQTLHLVNNLSDVDGLGAFTYQWYADGKPIFGANASALLLIEALVGKIISASASYTDGAGYQENVRGATTQPVANVNDLPRGTVSISGTAAQGQTLTAENNLADADGMGPVEYQWYADGVAISGQNGANLTLTLAQVGKAITASASYVDGHGTLETVASAATPAVLHVDTPGVLEVNGAVAAGAIVTTSISDVDGTGSSTYLWQASDGNGGWTTIDGASGSSLLVTNSLAGLQLRVEATYTDGYGTLEQLSAIMAPSSASHLQGSDGNDLLIGGAGDDVLTGGAGNDMLQGGAGTDVAAYAGAAADYNVVRTATGLQVIHQAGAEGVDTLRNVERLYFSDTGIAYDNIAGQAYRLYQAAFDRTPDTNGLGYWIAALDQGGSLQHVAASFIVSDEFQSRYGGLASNRAVLNELYHNILHRTPNASELDYWNGILDNGDATLDQVLVSFSESPENQQALAAVIGAGVAYQPFL